MLRKSTAEILVGLFMLAGVLAFVGLAFKVSGLAQYSSSDYYVVTADFDNIGDLKVRAPVTIGGVRVGQVGLIDLDPSTFRARVSFYIDKKDNNIPADSSAGIFTQGLLGSNYISLTPGFDTEMLKNGSKIENTRSALILENLIGQFLVSMGGKDSSKSGKDSSGKQ